MLILRLNRRYAPNSISSAFAPQTQFGELTALAARRGKDWLNHTLAGRQRKSMEKWEIRPPLPQKPLDRSSPKFAWVIMSGTPTPMQNFITIRLLPFAHQICENAHQVTRLVFLVLPGAYSQEPCTDLDRKSVV